MGFAGHSTFFIGRKIKNIYTTMMNLEVKHIGAHRGHLRFGGRTYPCALGAAGVTTAKQEGDHATPVGAFPLRKLYYRADRLARPVTSLDIHEIHRSDGWCDDPDNPCYNRQISKPFDGRHEDLWRRDGLYDLVIVIGHNDDPPVSGQGSCIFMHVMRPDFGPTEGCVALRLNDLLEIIPQLGRETVLRIR
jgi:L,D-peptidoglycan transpeptidase YkuD (ErfK/YbiS/YcfS/YnhG family)